MKNVLIIYASRRGQTKKIADKLAESFEEGGARARVADVAHLSGDPIHKYDTVIFGTPVYMQKTDSKLARWVKRHQEELQNKTTGLYLVCLNAADPRPAAREAEKEIVRNFERKSSWAPRYAAVFAGALNYRDYNPFLRFIMKRISKEAGGPTDTSKNYEMTDWSRVRSFARAVLAEKDHGPFFAAETVNLVMPLPAVT